MSSSSCRSSGGRKNAVMLFTVICTGDRRTVKSPLHLLTFELALADATHRVIDDLQGLRFHVKPLVGALVQRVGLEEEGQQRRPRPRGCLLGGEQDRRRPVAGQTRHLEQAELGCDPAGETKRGEVEVRRWRPPTATTPNSSNIQVATNAAMRIFLPGT